MYLLTLKAKYLFVLVAITASQVGCNGNETKTNNTVAPQTNDSPVVTQNKAIDKAVICEYYIDEKKGQDMIDKFENTYPKLVGSSATHKLTDEFWIDSCVISSLVSFFDANSICDGARFYFIGDKKTNLVIVPTFPPSSGSLPPRHSDMWGNIVTDLCGTSGYLNMSENDGKTGRENFGTSFRMQTSSGEAPSAKHDSLSSAVWFDECVLRNIGNLVLDKTNGLDGVMAFCAAHLEFEHTRRTIGQQYENQSTLIFVPTKGRTPYWKIVSPPPAIDAAAYKKTSGAFNHGQLCPQICD